MEKRHFTRIGFEAVATVLLGESRIEGLLENLGMKGVFFHTQHPIPLGQALSIRIELAKNDEELAFTLNGTVVRTEASGIGIEFDLHEISIDALTHLRNIVGYNVGDTDLPIQEFFAYLKK